MTVMVGLLQFLISTIQVNFVLISNEAHKLTELFLVKNFFP